MIWVAVGSFLSLILGYRLGKAGFLIEQIIREQKVGP